MLPFLFESFRMAVTGKVAKTFDAFLERSGDRLNWTVIRVPLDVARTWGVRGQLKVKGEINGFAFRTCLFPDGKGSHLMIVNKKMQAGGKVSLGMKARFGMEPDTSVREVAPPQEFLRVLGQSKRLKKFYDSFSYSHRREMARWVAEGKHGETRRRRAEQIAERLMLTMEAEHDLPPVLKVALARNPRAREGWERMPPGQRRSHLMGIFHYRNPESQARRLGKAMEVMLEYADKQAHKNQEAGESQEQET
jgi:uncharacterized protein YdeI (YjbR/CyaY-like superfamily)